MKKALSIVLILALTLGLGLVFTGCGDDEPYSEYNLSEYITLPDYNTYEVKVPDVTITDDAIDAQIQKNLEAAATTTAVKEGYVDEGDTVTVKFEGTLEDGTTSDGMKSEGSKLTLGSGQFIDGFEEGLYGVAIGEEVSLDLHFPDPYPNSPDLAGKGVTFKVTVLSKDVKDIPELTDAFVKANSEVETIAEYRKEVAKALEQAEYEDQLYDIKFDLYSQIIEETEVLKYPEKEVNAQIEELTQVYKDKAKSSGKEWLTYLTEDLKMTEKEFNEEAKAYGEELVKQEMIIYAIAEKENIVITDEEYDEYLQEMLDSAGFKDEAAFKSYTGMTLEAYAEEYKLDRDLLLTRELDTIYERLVRR